MKKIFVLLNFILLSPAFAETCPTVKEIKHNHFASWKAFDSETEKPLSAKGLHHFKQYVDTFVLAEWFKIKNHQETIRCFYRDKQGSSFAFLTKEHFRPDNQQNYWYKVSGNTQCAAGLEQCMFNPLITTKILAKK